jgi:hypothetical protein
MSVSTRWLSSPMSKTAMNELCALYSKECEAVFRGDFEGCEQLQSRLKKARDIERLMTERYRTHTDGHGC